MRTKRMIDFIRRMFDRIRHVGSSSKEKGCDSDISGEAVVSIDPGMENFDQYPYSRDEVIDEFLIGRD